MGYNVRDGAVLAAVLVLAGCTEFIGPNGTYLIQDFRVNVPQVQACAEPGICQYEVSGTTMPGVVIWEMAGREQPRQLANADAAGRWSGTASAYLDHGWNRTFFCAVRAGQQPPLGGDGCVQHIIGYFPDGAPK